MFTSIAISFSNLGFTIVEAGDWCSNLFDETQMGNVVNRIKRSTDTQLYHHICEEN